MGNKKAVLLTFFVFCQSGISRASESQSQLNNTSSAKYFFTHFFTQLKPQPSQWSTTTKIAAAGLMLGLAYLAFKLKTATTQAQPRQERYRMIEGVVSEVYGSTKAIFAPNDRYIITSKCERWYPGTSVTNRFTAGDTLSIYDLVTPFNPDGTKIVTIEDNENTNTYRAHIRNASTGDVILTLTDHTNSIMSANFNHDGTQIVTASLDGTVRTWDATNGALKLTLRHIGQEGQHLLVSSAIFSPDGTKILTADRDGMIYIWNTNGTLRLSWQVPHPSSLFKSDKGPGRYQNIAFNPDNLHIMTTGKGIVHIWNAGTGTLEKTLNKGSQGIYSAAFNHRGDKIVTGDWNGSVQIWDSRTGKPVQTLQDNSDSHVQSAKFSPDNTDKIVTLSNDKTVRIYQKD